MKTINLEEIFDSYSEEVDCDYSHYSYTRESILMAMKKACEQVLELASENVDNVIEKSEEDIHIVLAQEINNSILDTINQIK